MHKRVFIILFSFLFAFAATAQNKEYIYEDSTLQQEEAPIEETGVEIKDKDVTTETDQSGDTKPDTTLYFNKLTISADTIEAWKNAKAFGYTKYLDSLLKEKKKETDKSEVKVDSGGPGFFDRIFASEITKVIFWIGAAIFVAFIIYRLFLADGVFRKASAKNDIAVPVVEEEIITPESNFDALIKQAIATGNYRLAVRYHYLKTLHLLAAKGWVQLAGDKTNFQYVREISRHEYQDGFSKLTLAYEYVWYGEFNIDDAVYTQLQNEFAGFIKKI